MIRIVNILGGLGNQMFQYAFATALKAEYPRDEIKINILCFNGYSLHNGFEIEDIFSVIKFPHATIKDLLKVAWPWFHYRLWQVGTRILPKRHSMAKDTDYDGVFKFQDIEDKSYFDGYWQSPKFIDKHRELIKKTLQFPLIEHTDIQNLYASRFITSDKTAFIHVRRGDYVNHPKFGGICTTVYYQKAITLLIDKYHYNQFIIFSNDISWCKENLSSLYAEKKVIYVDWNRQRDSFRDIQLMSMCKAGIIANSSFSWWGAWLGNMEVVISPAKWTTTPNYHIDIIPDDWIKIST